MSNTVDNLNEYLKILVEAKAETLASVSGLPADVLAVDMKAVDAVLGWLNECTTTLTEIKTAYEGELSRRQLTEYWQAHPELMPVNGGDKVLITQTFIEKHHTKDRVGRIVEILRIDELFGFPSFHIEGERWGEWSLNAIEASAMRRAYLAAHESEQP